MKDPRDPLSNTLQTWTHEPAHDADFNDHVWARILAEQQTASAAATASAIARDSTRRFGFLGSLPLAASIAVIFAVAAGTTTAFALNNARTSERMAATYARSIDPVLMTSIDSPAHNHSADQSTTPPAGHFTGHSAP